MIDRKKLSVIKTNRRKLEEVIDSLTSLNIDFDDVIDNIEDDETIAVYEVIQDSLIIAKMYILDGIHELEDVIYNEC